MATAEDMRVLLERIGGMERALMEQQARAHQAAPALQALQRQQTAQQAQRWAAAAQAPRHMAALLSWIQGYSGNQWCSMGELRWRWSHRPWICWCWETKDVAAMRTTHKDLDTRAASALLCDMLMMVRQEGPQKLLESRSCFADTARCQARMSTKP